MSVASAFVKTWVMALTGGVPAWDESQWAVENRLIPVKSNKTPGSMGQATFRLMRRTRSDDNSGSVTSTWQPVKGMYIAITTQACTLPGAAGTRWVGYIDDFDTQPLKNTDDEIGTVLGRELGGVLRQVPLANPRVFDLTGGSADGIALLTIPTANSEGLTQGEVIGNAVDAPAGVQPGGYTRSQWAGKPDDCGTSSANYWSRWALVDHFMHWNYSPLLPDLALIAASDVQTLLTTAAKEVFKLNGLRFDGLLSLMAGSTRGLQWWITVSSSAANTWNINIASAIDVGVGDIPAATLTAATVESNDVAVRLSTSGYDMYDAVEVNGSACVFAGTVSPIDSTAAAGWGSTSETDYKAGASGAGGYGSLTGDQQVARNRMVRKSGLLADVYSRYLVAQDATYQFQCKAVSGLPVAGSVQFFCPLITWSGTIAAIDNTNNMSPYPPEARLLRQLPWPEGKQGNGTDLRNAEQKARPRYLSPVVLSYQVPGFNALNWADMAHPPFKLWSAPSINIDSRGPALRVEFEYPEMLAAVDWTSGTPAVTEYDPTLSTTYGASDWRNLVMTVAMASDQRVKVAAYRSGTTSTTYRNPLRIDRPDIHCWVVRAHTIIGLNIDGTPDEVTTDTFVRNDFAVAQKLADEAAAFAFRPRSSGVITLTQPQNPPAWADIGITIGSLLEQKGGVTQVTRTLNTYITNIEQDWDVRRPRLIVSTGDAGLPDSTAIVPLAPSFGGPVSVALGMTLPATVQRIDAELKDVQKAQEKVPIKTGRLPAPGATADTTYIRVAWGVDFVNHFDTSSGQEVDASGVDISPANIVWIDSIGSCRPEFFGNVWYEAVRVGTEYRGATRDVYRLIRIAPLSGTGTALFECSFAATSALYDNANAAITTIINGSSVNNSFGGINGMAGLGWCDAQRRPSFKMANDGSFSYLQIIPDHFQSGRRRSGFISSQISASVAKTATVSIDPYETFELHYSVAAAGSNSVAAGATYDSGIIRCTNTQSGSLVVDDGFAAGSAISVDTSASLATERTNPHSSMSSHIISVLMTNSTGTALTTTNITFTLTLTSGRITAITETGSSGVFGSFAVVGGRPTWTGE